MTPTNAPDAIPADVLEPCPFCGGPAHIVAGSPGCHYVRCHFCGATSDDRARETAVELWNTRASRAPVGGTGWRPIETAPNVKTILIHYAEGETEVVAADDNYFKWIPYDPEGLGNQPTHWMPLPVAPGTVPAPVDGAEAKRCAEIADELSRDELFLDEKGRFGAELTAATIREEFNLPDTDGTAAPLAHRADAKVIRSGKAVQLNAEERADRNARGLHVEWAEGVGYHYFPSYDPKSVATAPASPDAEMVRALKRIEGGHFDDAATLALAGDFRGIVERLQGIAREALSKHGGDR